MAAWCASRSPTTRCGCHRRNIESAQAPPPHSDTAWVRDYVNAGAAVAALELEVTGGPAAGQQFGVHEDFRIGSGENGPGTLGGDRWLSAAHALFHRGPDGWAVQDLRSLEGTKVNGQALRGAVMLGRGDVVERGASRIVVLPEGVASVEQMVAESPQGVSHALSADSRRPLDARRVIAYLLDVLVVLIPTLVLYKYGRGRWVFVLGATGVGLVYY